MKRLILPIICAVIGAAMICASFAVGTAPNVTEAETEEHGEYVNNTQTPLKLTSDTELFLDYAKPAPKPEWITVTATAYCPCSKCCGKWADGITASGATAAEGVTIAADWSIFPNGTVLYIEGVGERIVQDTGVYGYWIDIYHDSHEAALKWGLQTIRVQIVKGDNE